MKKKIAALIVGLSMFAGMGSAYAAVTPDASAANAKLEAKADHVKKFAVLKEFQDELHKIDALRVERLGLKTQIVQKDDRILDLMLAARESGNKDALKQAREVRKQIHAADQEQQGKWEAMRAEVKAFRQAVKDRNQEQAQAHIDSAIAIFGEINAKLGAKAGLLDQIIDILS
jgi:hypothetical protein